VAAKGALRRSPASATSITTTSPTDCSRINSSDATRPRRRWGEEANHEPLRRCH
jgi:hypothetical protein